VRRGSSGCQVGLEGLDRIGLCLQKVITPLKDSLKVPLEDSLIDSTMNGSGDLLMEERPQLGTFLSGMSIFRKRVF
jgi:hypothetical protein